MSKLKEFWSKYRTVILQVILAVAAGGLASLLGGETAELYKRLQSPPLAPPGWVFPLVWTVLYILMGVAAGRVAQSGDMDREKALTFYYLQLGINVIWPLLFFRLEWITLAAVWLLLLTLAVFATWRQFRLIDPVAGWLLVPYLLWCLFALYLIVGFVVLNYRKKGCLRTPLFLFYSVIHLHTDGQEVRTGVTSREILKSYLPLPWAQALASLPGEVGDRIQEVRLRAGEPLTVALPEGMRYLFADGITALRQPGCYICSAEQVEECFLAFCRHSVYAHEWELAQGYLAVEGGIRVGVAGTAILRNGGIGSVQRVTSLCVRLPRRIAGCAKELLDVVLSEGYPVNTLLVGPPACGKTTLLRDLASQLAGRRYAVSVVDERGELYAAEGLQGCDVLRGYPKAVGLRQAVRCLAPQVVLFDEMGDPAEVEAVAACAHAGVAVVATLHGYDPHAIGRQPMVYDLIHRRIFERWVFLQGRSAPGQIRNSYIPEVTPYGVDWRPANCSRRDGDGAVRFPSSAPSRTVFGDLRSPASDVVAGDGLYHAAAGSVMAAVGVP